LKGFLLPYNVKDDEIKEGEVSGRGGEKFM
jgi:hypothetical protein